MGKVSATFAGGRTVESNADLWMCLSDRVAFERKFGKSTMSLAKFAPQNGNGDAPADTTARDDEAAEELREEWLAFFVWRCLRRDHADVGDFDAFIDQVVNVEVDSPGVTDETVGENPSVPAPQPT